MTPDELIKKYLGKSVLIDSNLLVLLAVGIYNRDRISTFNRTRQYSSNDFELLVRLMDLFRKRIVTPHIFAETDNLLRQLSRAEHGRIAAVLAAIVTDSFEIYLPSLEATRHEKYAHLGLTDCTIIAASQDALVITDDFRLAGTLVQSGRDAININHLRTLN
jgi:hypothetical protein